MKNPPDRTLASLGADRHAAFYREGEYWTIAYDGAVLRLRDSKGLHCLAHLLRRPGEQIAALELLDVPASTSSDQASEIPSPHAPEPPGPSADLSNPEEARVVVTKRIKAAVKKIQAHHPALGYHLSTTVKTGAHCTYSPDPDRPPRWDPGEPQTIRR